MNSKLIVSHSIEIKGTATQVWDAMTNPEKIKIYLFGTQADTDWKVGSPIKFHGDFNGTKYEDKGNVLENQENKLLKYNYWAQYSGLPDEPQNYFLVTYRIVENESGSTLTWEQEGFANEDAMKRTDSHLPAMLIEIKKVVEG